MKTLITIATFFLLVSVGVAKDFIHVKDTSQFISMGDSIDSQLTAVYDKECNCLLVKTNKATFKIYPCGKIEKLTWKEINPNEEQGTLQFYNPQDTITIPGFKKDDKLPDVIYWN